MTCSRTQSPLIDFSLLFIIVTGWLKIDDGNIRWCELAQARIFVYRKPQQKFPDYGIFLCYRIVEILSPLTIGGQTVRWSIRSQHAFPGVAATIIEAPDSETASMWLGGIREEMNQTTLADIHAQTLRPLRAPVSLSQPLDEAFNSDAFVQNIKLWVGTWNLGDSAPQKEGLESWLKPEKETGSIFSCEQFWS